MNQTVLRLNGVLPTDRDTREFTLAIGDSKILTASGGYLFKSRFDGEILHIGIVPAISGGTRLHHYDIEVPEGRYLLGSLSTNGEFSLLFKASEDVTDVTGKLAGDARIEWRTQYQRFALGLINAGYSAPGRLDWISRKIIEESGLFLPVPTTLGEIADQPEIE